MPVSKYDILELIAKSFLSKNIMKFWRKKSQLKNVFERYAGVIEADVIKNYGFVHIDANAGM